MNVDVFPYPNLLINDQGVILEVSELFSVEFNCNQQIVGENIASLFQSSDQNTAAFDFLSPLNQAGVVRYQSDCLLKISDHQALWVQATVCKAKKDYLVSFVKHNTFKGIMFDQVQENAFILDSKLVTLGRTSSDVGHELKNIVSVILVKLELLKAKIKKQEAEVSKLLPQLQTDIEKLFSLSSRAGKISLAMNNFARVEAPDEISLASVSSIIEESQVFIQERLKTSDINLQIAVKDDVLIKCHPHQITQVLINLIYNSCDSLSNASDKSIQLDVQKTDHGLIQFALTDSGPCPDDQVIKNMFKPFFTTKQNGQGAGLGLSVSQRIIEAHGGSIKIDPESPQTRVVFTLPFAQG
jgi:signal transduction histidine kinase